uniref:UDENN domain-containing protein n=1 Tax=Meloidogyne javanica TaxID=6303 RepID=A0A915MYC5_MELJA
MEPGSQRLFQPGKTCVANSICPRLIDYIVIVGSRPSTSSKRRRIPTQNGVAPAEGGLFNNAPPGGVISHPELLRRYPNENHRDFELPRDVVYFCQPEGAVSYTGSGFHQLKKRNLFNEATSFVFMLTEKDTAKVRYGVTLSFFLSLGAKQKEQQQPNSPTVIPNNTTIEQQKQRQHHKHSSSGSAHLISLCLLSHHPFLSAFRDLMHLFRHLADCCNYRANLDESLPRDAVWTVLAGHWPQGMSIPMPVMQELRQLETWLFTLLSSPVPVPGNTKLLLEVLPSDMMPTPLEFALPDYTRFSLVDFPLHLPLELLGVEAVMQILAAIMLEYKVVLQSRNYNAVSMCVMALVAMLYPLEYMFPVIPLLPAFMPSAEQLLLAPTPFIIGLPASFFHFKGIQIPSDVLLADLDTNRLIMPSDQSVRIPQFPEYEAAILREEFLRAMGKHPTEGHELLENGIVNSTIDGDEIDVKCRVAMIHFYSGPNVFANFSEHTRTIRLYPRPVVALQVDSFLRSRGQNNEFISELCKTQAVEDDDAESEFATTATSSDLESVGSVETGGAWSPFGSRSPLNLDISKPLSDACDIYQAPNRLELPKSESKMSIDSSDISSCRSSPLSGDFTFANSGHATDEETTTVCENSSSILTNDSTTSLPLNGSQSNLSSSSSTKNNLKNNRPLAIMNKALNSGQGVFDQMMKKGAPKAAQAMAKALPLAEAVSNRVMEEGRGLLNRTAAKHSNEYINDSMSINTEAMERLRKLRERENAAAAQQQRKSQQQILEICEQVISGQGIGVFSGSKVKRLLEDESLRELVCSKLNMGLEVNYAEDEFLQDVQLSRAQYRGYLKLLQACIIGLESNFNMADSQLGLASAFHVLEIAHTHYWTPLQQSQTPSGGGTLNSVTDGIKSLPLPPRNVPSTNTIELTSYEKSKDDHPPPHHPPPPTQSPPPLPERPRSATSETGTGRKDNREMTQNIKNEEKISLSTTNLLNNSTHEIKVKDAVHIENKQKENDLLGSLPTSSNVSSAGANMLWLRMPFWETAFLDMMDEEPAEMIDRYSQLSEADRKRLELEEDRILATLLHNMTAMMHLCHVPVRTIQQKVRRMLGKAHIGLIYSKRINQLLDELITLPPTGKISLKPLVSRLIQKQVFAVHEGSNAEAPLCFLEICDDAIILRACNGAIQERWWYERMVNMTYSPKARVLCLWQRHDDQVHMHKFHTKKARDIN